MHPDSASSELLIELRNDIERLLGGERAAGAALAPGSPSARGALPAQGSLPERLERLAVQFEADHPTLAASSRRLVDLLGKAGL